MCTVKGGNCDIYLDKENNIAIKKLRNTSSQERIKRFRQELEIVKELSTDKSLRICEIKNINIDEKITDCYYEMKLYDGNLYDLFSMTKGNVILSCSLLLPIVKTLKILSEREKPIYHRDIKPDNILFIRCSDEIDLFLADFGNGFIKNNDKRITPEDVAVGARMFIAPEYELGRVESVDCKGDIFSLGKVLWCMVNGNPIEYLPSNFWFVNSFNLKNRFPNNSDVLKLNIVIASCLNTNPEERCNYVELIKMLEDIIIPVTAIDNPDEVVKVIEFAEKRKYELIEIMEKNKNLVNIFSFTYVETLQLLMLRYANFPLLNELIKYKNNSKDGINYWSISVEKNSNHYLYSTSFDLIYIAIDYIPAKNTEKYAHITLRYILKNGYQESCEIRYNSNNSIYLHYKDKVEMLNTKSLLEFLNNLILNYINS